jgi:hypothetical protein
LEFTTTAFSGFAARNAKRLKTLRVPPAMESKLTDHVWETGLLA